MNLPACLRNRAVTYFAAVLLFIGGIVSFLGLGQLEDPEFTIKNALIITTYPGASPTEVEQEITDRIELATRRCRRSTTLSRSPSKAFLRQGRGRPNTDILRRCGSAPPKDQGH